MEDNNPSARDIKLKKLFESIIRGNEALARNNNTLFLEAIYTAPDAAVCTNRLIASDKGLASLQSSMRFDLTDTFFNGPAAKLLQYFSTPELTSISGGDFLRQVLLAIVEPPIFWTSFLNAFKAGRLQEDAQFCFAWLLLQLIQLPVELASSYRALAQEQIITDILLSSQRSETRFIAYTIMHKIATCGVGASFDLDYGPGGRHDNDFVDFREIAILPTADELVSKERPFLRAISESEALHEVEENRLATHLDNQFRLLREDMLYEMREELQIALGMKAGKHRGILIDGLSVRREIHCKSSDDLDDKKCKWGITLRCHADIPHFRNVKPQDRRTYLKNNRHIFKHQSIACLIVDGEIVAFPTVNRDEGLLAEKPPVIVLQLDGEKSTTKALLKLSMSQNIKLLQIDTAIFSYEPILKALKEKQSIPLSQELLSWSEGDMVGSPPSQHLDIVDAIKANPSLNLQTLLSTPKRIDLDQAQVDSLILGLTQRVSLIQGPPGTGKSFLGALLAKILHDRSKQPILVVCYTNHALDQFLEDLLDIGIPATSLVRLGGKSTTRTAPLALQNQAKTYKFGHADWVEINRIKATALTLSERLGREFKNHRVFKPPNVDILEHLEFEDSKYFEAFGVPVTTDGMWAIGKGGRKVSPDYLIERWIKGQDPGIFKTAPNVQKASEIWNMPRDSRQTCIVRWKEAMSKELIDVVYSTGKKYNLCQNHIDRKFSENSAVVLRNKRIIGCTTTGAAKYREYIDAARPGVLLVEEAGEILESHILTALGAETEHLILIGDHKQLRPKVNNYMLTVEKGKGYDLNRSLFERLALKGYPHETLREQHRMRPEISALVRQLTYPDLVDAPKTQNRSNLRGVQDNVVFIDHEHTEDDFTQIEDPRDMGAKSSKQNRFEVGMVLKMVRYLGQQGYGTDDIVILTPYLGQLREMQEALKQDNDPVLNDLDSYDLVRAGLVSSSAANVDKKPIRLATIDNYQGEESKIVIISLTRSNASHDIGFMSSPERMTVLLSRARDALIMIGNSHTFMNSRRGGGVWTKLFGILKSNGHIYDGFPVKCERHMDRISILKDEHDFDKECPDGGCQEPCGVMLNCGLHPCPSKCHQLSDHSKMPCEYVMHTNCSNGHLQQWKCHKGQPATCGKCDHDAKMAEKKRQKDFDRQEAQRLHLQRMAELDEKISRRSEAAGDAQVAEERKRAIQQKENDLREASLISTIVPPASPTHSTTQPPTKIIPKGTSPSTPRARPPIQSAARNIWQRQKDVDGVTNKSIDAIMEMTGLEEVKSQMLKIKDKVDTTKRQNSLLTGERFNVAMLGNPGTGKTTVARHYGKFLASVEVIPGDTFVETTGSRLANDGVAGVKKILEEITNAGGGTIFVDEAYQLTSEHNFQGNQVLDFLLAEMENRVGKIVFIFAGYNKEMEKFFQHNPGFTSRVPYSLQFRDYEDDELLDMLEHLIEKKSDHKMKVDDEDGIRGLYGRIAVRRLGRGRGRNGFGNARALENMLAKIRERQAERLTEERRQGLRPDDFLLKKEDLIGPEPSKVVIESTAWKKLQSMIGLGSIKKAVTELFTMVDMNYKRELLEKNPHQISLNRVFLGSPGTGKTTVAKHYGRILADLGLISNGEVVIKNPADFIGSVLGQSESQTKAILASTVGKVLIIDEAYMLYGGSGGADSYKTAVIDTIVAEVQSVPGEDRCVLLLGYRQQIEEMFQNVNPGLARRFAIEDAFHFHDYTDSELMQALEWKLKDQDLTATDAAKNVAIEMLSRARNRPNFGNIGAVENLLSQAKSRYQSRQASLPMAKRSPDAPFEPQDFDPEFNRSEHASSNLFKLFEDVVGCEEIIKKLEGWQNMARNMKALGKDPREHIPTNFVFKGPPGTGKATTARKMGQVYFDMGFLGSTEVVECSASDLVGQYVGQTGPKTKNLFEKALGRVLFVDEAYRLSQGTFAKEAMDELVGILTQETFRAKLVVILAGYDQEMNELMAVNTGLSSRFPDEIIFQNIQPVKCLEVLSRKLRKQDIRVDALEDSSSADFVRMVELLQELSVLPSWGNARDLETLSKQMMAIVYTTLPTPGPSPFSETDTLLTLPGTDAVICIEKMLSSRRERCNVHTHHNPGPAMQQMLFDNQAPQAPAISTTKTTAKSHPPPQPEIKQAKMEERFSPPARRDVGVTEEVWKQLQTDKKAAEDSARCVQEVKKLLEQATEDEAAAQKLTQELAMATAKDTAEKDELMRRREEARLRKIAAKEELSRRSAALEAQERKERQEAQVQAKLRQMGVCVAGFQWIKQASGYRCAGGSHFIDNATLGI